jgi:hypothetical protein
MAPIIRLSAEKLKEVVVASFFAASPYKKNEIDEKKALEAASQSFTLTECIGFLLAFFGH